VKICNNKSNNNTKTVTLLLLFLLPVFCGCQCFFASPFYATNGPENAKPIHNKKPSCRYDSRPYCHCTGVLRYCLTAALGVTWSHRSRDHLILHMSFPIAGSLKRIKSPLQPFSRYCALSILVSRSSLTFEGHVMSSVTWPFDSYSPYAISYWWSFGTNPSLYL